MDGAFLTILPTKSKLFPHTKEVLDYLANKNYRMHLITNGFDAIQAGKLENSKLTEYFEQVVTSERSNSLKPNREIFQFALSESNAEKDESIMLGDNQDADIKGAADFGMDTVWVNHIAAEQKVNSTYTVTDLKQLLEIF